MVTCAHLSAMFGNQRRRGRARADHHDLLAVRCEIIRPGLRMHDAALEVVHAVPFRRIAFGMAIVALAHPEEIRGYRDVLAAVGLLGLDGPEIFLARPARAQDPVLVADVSGDIVVLDHLAHIGADFFGGRDRRPDPGLEAVAEGVEIAVRADARIFMRPPGAAKGLLRLQDDEARAGKSSSADDRRCRCRKCRRRRSARRNVQLLARRTRMSARAVSTFMLVLFLGSLAAKVTAMSCDGQARLRACAINQTAFKSSAETPLPRGLQNPVAIKR